MICSTITRVAVLLLLLLPLTAAFSTVTTPTCISFVPTRAVGKTQITKSSVHVPNHLKTKPSQNHALTTTSLSAAVPDLDVVALVAGQENYGLAIVCVGEALWSFFQAPSLDHAKVLVPAAIAALVLGVVSGPMITSGDAATVSTGLFIATGVSIGLGASYVARLLAPYSPSAKEIAALGLLVAIAGFFSFSQNLVVDGFVALPSIPLPSLPEISLPSIDL